MGSVKRARRSERSDNIDMLTASVAAVYGKKPWTAPDLRNKRISVTNGIIAFLHHSGYIKKNKTLVRPYPNAPLCPMWSLTEKGLKRATVTNVGGVA